MPALQDEMITEHGRWVVPPDDVIHDRVALCACCAFQPSRSSTTHPKPYPRISTKIPT